MKTQQLVCNDCGCRFEIRDREVPGGKPVQTKGAGEDKEGQGPLSCPECRSYNITTA